MKTFSMLTREAGESEVKQGLGMSSAQAEPAQTVRCAGVSRAYSAPFSFGGADETHNSDLGASEHGGLDNLHSGGG